MILHPKVPRGFRDLFANDLTPREKMLDTIKQTCASFGFVQLDTPTLEFVDILGKYLPEADQPMDGIFAFRDDTDSWVALRYDLTAPLSRVVAQHSSLPKPYRRFQYGNVYRMERPGPGRYREFCQFDVDIVGSSATTADADIVIFLISALQNLGFERGEFQIKISNRKIINQILSHLQKLASSEAWLKQMQLWFSAPHPADACELIKPVYVFDPSTGQEIELKSVTPETKARLKFCKRNPNDLDISDERIIAEYHASILRCVDKFDRLGLAGVQTLLAEGRLDESGHYMSGCYLNPAQIKLITDFMTISIDTRKSVLEQLRAQFAGINADESSINELAELDSILSALGFNEQCAVFDPTIVRGLGYYTGIIYEAALATEIEDEQGNRVKCGSIAGGGRYDELVGRFDVEQQPACGASIGVDRLLLAFSRKHSSDADAVPPVLITVMDKDKLPEYFKMALELRSAGIPAEVYSGNKGIRQQFKYADQRGLLAVVVAGSDEFEKGEVQIKNLWLGRQLAAGITERDAWRKDRPSQFAVSRSKLVESLKELIDNRLV